MDEELTTQRGETRSVQKVWRRGRVGVMVSGGALAFLGLVLVAASPAYATGVSPITSDPTGGVANSVFQSILNVIFSAAVLAPLISLTVAFFILHFVMGMVKSRRSKVGG